MRDVIMRRRRLVVFFFILYVCLYVGLTEASANCDVATVNAVLQPSGIIAVDHRLVQCDTVESSVTVNLAHNFPNIPDQPVVAIALAQQSGPAPILGLPVAIAAGIVELTLRFTELGKYVLLARRNILAEGAVAITVTIGPSCQVTATPWRQAAPPWGTNHYDHSYFSDTFPSASLSPISQTGRMELTAGSDPPIEIKLAPAVNNLLGLQAELLNIGGINAVVNTVEGGYRLLVYNNRCLSRVCAASENNLKLKDLLSQEDFLSKRSISSAGCLLTALAIAFDAASVSSLSPSSIPLNPGTLNSFMSNTLPGMERPGGVFDQSGNVILPNTVMAMRRHTGKLLEFVLSALDSRFNFYAALEVLDSALCAEDNYPVIVGVRGSDGSFPGHFVVVVGKENGPSGTRYKIIDPGHANRNELNHPAYTDLNGQPEFQIRGFVKDPPGDASAIGINSADVAELLLIDTQGRRTGFDVVAGAAVEEIPNAAYWVDTVADPSTGERVTGVSHQLWVSRPGTGKFRLVVLGIQTGVFMVSLRAHSTDGTPLPEVVLKGITSPNSFTTFEVQYEPVQGAMLGVRRAATFSEVLGDINNSLRLGLISNVGIVNSLSQKIHAAQNASGVTRINILNAFKNDVLAQEGKHIASIIARVLLEDADSLLTQVKQ